MRRKIPGRKHHGVRDPEKQALERYQRIKDKINLAPTNPDDQPIPKSLTKIMDLKNRTKNGEFDKKKKNKKKYQGLVKAESESSCLYRVNKMVETVKRETLFEIKYGVKIKRNAEGEVTEVVKQPKDELKQLLNKKRKEKLKGNKGKKSKNKEKPVKLTKGEKLKLKLAEKKRKKEENGPDFKDLKDNVKFGDRVDAPPTLSLPKKLKKETSRPGTKDLLLKPLLNNNNKENNKKINNLNKNSKAIDKKGKRKDMPHALRRQLDKQQQEIINAYKNIKAQKYKTN